MRPFDASITDRPSALQAGAAEFSADVQTGLSRPGQKELPSKYLYDAIGSALFEVITLLPEYGLTRADVRLIHRHARDIAGYAQPSVVIELGSGSGGKARGILEAQAVRQPLTYCPIDLSKAALRRSVQELSDIAGLGIRPIEASYVAGLRNALRLRRPGTPALVLFLGSSIGNFAPAEAESFLGRIRQELEKDDLFLLSTDLEKDERRMLAAYDDSIGVTAAFNLNVLARINRELDGDFNLKRFEHQVRYDRGRHRIEMHLRSRMDHTSAVGPLRIALLRDETIWTESSYKFQPSSVSILASAAGFQTEAQWIDAEWPFAQTLLRV